MSKTAAMRPAVSKPKKAKRPETASRGKQLPEIKADSFGEIALCYGFSPFAYPEPSKEDIVRAKNFGSDAFSSNRLFPLERKISLVRNYNDNGMFRQPMPIMIFGSRSDGKKRSVMEMDVIGAPKSASEATLITAACAMLQKAGHKNLYVNINSVGEKENMARFERDLGAYYKKNLSDLSACCKQAIKKNAFGPLACCDARCKEIGDGAPMAVSYLSDGSRRHFKDVLEYLETCGIPYQISNRVLWNASAATHTIYEIRAQEEEGKKHHEDEILAFGARYNQLSRKLGGKKETPSAGISVFLPSSGGNPKTWKRPRFYLLQLGDEAKRKSLTIIEALRKARVFMHHSLSKDKLVSQLMSAESLGVSHLLIIGQKEAVENCVVVRDMATRAQETVSTHDLADYLKKLK